MQPNPAGLARSGVRGAGTGFHDTRADTGVVTGAPANPVPVGADKALRAAAAVWFAVAAIGLWLFAGYTLGYYGAFLWHGGLPGLNDSHLPTAYVAGDLAGNLAIAGHLLVSVVVLAGGPLQLLPQLRRYLPACHRWLGRAFVAAASLASVSGLYMVWLRGSVGDFGQHVGITMNAAAIFLCAAMAVREARARRLVSHRRWAMRLFVAAIGVWFARVGLWLWVLLTGGAGVDFVTFTGPFLTFLNVGQWLLPLLVLEFYFLTQSHAGAKGRWGMAVLLAGLSVLTAVGVHEAAARIWLPRI